jgi:hypothetical protein
LWRSRRKQIHGERPSRMNSTSKVSTSVKCPLLEPNLKDLTLTRHEKCHLTSREHE